MTTNILPILALSIAFAALLLAISIIIYIVRWKTAFVIDNGEERFQLVPDDVITRNTSELIKLEKLSKRAEMFYTNLAQEAINNIGEISRAIGSSIEDLRKDHQKAYEAHQVTLRATQSLQEEAKIMRNEIQIQAAELERHRRGYDVDILSAALIPIARMHRMIHQDLNRTDLLDESRRTLEALEDEHLEVLETRGVKLVEPPIGSLYRDQKNVKHPPDTVPASVDSELGTIKTIISPAYELETSARRVVLLEAEVVVFSAPHIQREDLASEIDLGDQNRNG